MEPLSAPKREKSEWRREDEGGDKKALGLLLGIALLVLGAIAYAHLRPQADVPEGSDLIAGEGGQMGGSGGYASDMPRSAAGSAGMRKEMVEQPLEKAKAIQNDRFAAPVSHVRDSDECSSLRNARQRVQEGMRKPHSKWQAGEYQKDLQSISSRGTEKGCWSGGAG